MPNARIEPAKLSPTELREFIADHDAVQRTSEYWDVHATELRAAYPDQWIALGPEGIIALAKTEQGLVRALRKIGRARGVRTEFLSSKPRTLIL